MISKEQLTPHAQHCCSLPRGLVLPSTQPAKSFWQKKFRQSRASSRTPTSPPDQLSSSLLWGPAPPPEPDKRVLSWCGPQCQDWSCLGRLGQLIACPWMPLHPCWVAVLLMPTLTAALLLGTDGLSTTCWPMATELGHFSACSFPFQLLLCLFYPLTNHVIVICHSLGQKLFFSEFFAQPLVQQNCNFSQHSRTVINRLCTKGNCILGGRGICSSGQPMCFPRARGHVD